MELGRAAARQSLLSVFVALVVVGLGATLPISAAGDADDPVAAAADSVVRVISRGCGWTRFGSGVRTASGVLTNEHVVANSVAVEVEMADGSSVEVSRVRVSDQLDLAILDLPPDVPGTGGDGRTVAAWAGVSARVGDVVEVIGHPGGGDRTRRRGRIQAEARGQIAPDPDRLWQLDVAVAPGSSGSGVFDRSGRLVGLVYAAAIGDQGALVMRGIDVEAAVVAARLTPFVGCPA